MQYALSHVLTDLIGRKVSFTFVAAGPETTARQVYGVYSQLSSDAPLVVKADLALLGSFAGALVGLSDSEVQKHLASSAIEELFADAIFEVLNVASSAIAPVGRAVLSKMLTDPADIQGTAQGVVAKPKHRASFKVVVEQYRGGMLTVLS